jgi:hypothetical protein
MLTIYAGMTFSGSFPLPGYSASGGWEISARLVNASRVIELDAALFSGSGTTWALLAPKATTTAWTAGDYTLQLVASQDGESVVVANRAARVVDSGAADLRSDARKALEEIDAILAQKASQDHSELSIDGRSIKRMGWTELLAARSHFAALVDAEDRALRGESALRKIPVRFANAT